MDLKEFRIEGMSSEAVEVAEAPAATKPVAAKSVTVTLHKRGYAVTIEGETTVYPFLGTAIKEVKEYLEAK